MITILQAQKYNAKGQYSRK